MKVRGDPSDNSRISSAVGRNLDGLLDPRRAGLVKVLVPCEEGLRHIVGLDER